MAAAEGYGTTHHRPSPPASDTTSQSKHSRKGSSQDSTDWKGAFVRPARRLSIFSRMGSVKDTKRTADKAKNEVVVDQLSPPASPRHVTLEAPPLIRTAWSDPSMAHDKESPPSASRRQGPSIRPVSYAGEPRYEIRTPTGTTPTGSTPPEGKTSKRTSRNYSSTTVIQDPPVRSAEFVHGEYTPRSSWGQTKTASMARPVPTNRDPAAPPPPPILSMTPPLRESTSTEFEDLEPIEPPTFSTEPEVSRFQHRESQRRINTQRTRQTQLENEITVLRARLAEQEAVEQADAEKLRQADEQQQADRRRERTYRERQQAATAAAAAAQEADRQYKDTAQRVAQLQAEVDELRLRREIAQERLVNRMDADTRAATRHMRSSTMPSSIREERRAPRTEGHRTHDGEVVWTETNRAGETSQRSARRSEGRAAQRNRDIRETLNNLTLGSEEALESDDDTLQGSREHGHGRRRRTRRHHRGHHDRREDHA